jgi:putative SOS response-associated peptidase YedK
MCGRFTLTRPAAIAARFELDHFAPPEPEFYTPRFNVAPMQRIVVIRRITTRRSSSTVSRQEPLCVRQA